MKKNKRLEVSLWLSLFYVVFFASPVAAATQTLPQTGEEIARTAIWFGGALVIIVGLIIFFRRKKEKDNEDE